MTEGPMRCRLAVQAGLHCLGQHIHQQPLKVRSQPPVLTLWKRMAGEALPVRSSA